MAETSRGNHTCSTLIIWLFLASISKANEVRVESVNFAGYLSRYGDNRAPTSALIEVEGHFGRVQWMASHDGDKCDETKAVAKSAHVPTQKSSWRGYRTTQILLPVPETYWGKQLYMCARTSDSDPWVHLGTKSEFVVPPVTQGGAVKEDDNKKEAEEDIYAFFEDNRVISRMGRAIDDYSDFNSVNGTVVDDANSRIFALQLKIVSKDVGYSEDGRIEVLKGSSVSLNVYGHGLGNDSEIIFTSSKGDFGSECRSDGFHVRTNSYSMSVTTDGTTGSVTIPGGDLPSVKGQEIFYVCLRADHESPLLHQGSSNKGSQMKVYVLILPMWIMVIFIGVLLCLSGLFSGLNLGLMALDQTELKIIQNTGTEKERDYANKISPIRAHGNFLLCSLLLGNVLVNNSLTILLDTLTSGLVAVIGATMGIVVFGEIIPQAICSRHGLAVGAATIWLTKLFMLLTFPLSFPISKLLDKLLGAEIGTVYDKKKLIELLRVTNDNNDLEKEEVDIVTGALVYKEKTVISVMTRLEDCYTLPLKTILNFDTVSEIRDQGYSRIPIYDGDKNNIVHVMFAKDLMFIDPDDNMALAMVCEFYNNDVNFVFHDTPLNVMFNEFKSGEKGHMAFVQQVNTDGEGDPFYETIGLVTLEDIIEEIIQQEIVDETDVVTDNRTKKKRRRRENFKATEGKFQQLFGESNKKLAISAQLTMAVFQYLTTSIEPFKSTYMSEVVLKRLLTMDVYREVKVKKGDATIVCEEDLVIMYKGKPIDFFILIIEGKVEVNIGREALIFESGPFTYFGIQTLTQVIESLASPMVQHKVVTTPVSVTSLDSSSAIAALPPASSSSAVPAVGPKGSNLRKASTQTSMDVPTAASVPSLTKRNSADARLSTVPLYAPFIPDYTIKAVTDVLYLKINRATYLRAMKASLMNRNKKKTGGELNERELDSFLERVNEDETDAEMMMLQQTPVMGSPIKSVVSDLHLSRDKTTSNTSTPVMQPRKNVTNKKPYLNARADSSAKEDDEFWDEENMTNTKKKELDVAAVAGSNGPVLHHEPDSTTNSTAQSTAETVDNNDSKNGSASTATTTTVIPIHGNATNNGPSPEPPSDRTSLLTRDTAAS